MKHNRFEKDTQNPIKLERSIAISVLAILCSSLAPIVLALMPRSGDAVVVMTLWPDATIPHAILASGANVLSASAGGHFVIVPAATDDLVTDLYRNGATIVLAATPFEGCMPRATFSHASRTGSHP